MKQYVVGFMFDGDGQVLLIEKQNPQWQKGKLNGVGGKIEPGEEPHAAMAREFNEETGIPTEPARWNLAFTVSGPDYKLYVFFTMGPVWKATQQPGELENPVIVENWRKLPFNVIYNLRWMIPLIMDESVRLPIHLLDRVEESEHTGTEKLK